MWLAQKTNGILNFISFKLNLNCHMWLTATILVSAFKWDGQGCRQHKATVELKPI